MDRRERLRFNSTNKRSDQRIAPVSDGAIAVESEAWDTALHVHGVRGRSRELESRLGNSRDFLPAYKGPNGKQLYLTSIGFVGPSFSAYDPDCFSVFGFWDHFKDLPDVSNEIHNNRSIQLKVSYQVVGWINEPNSEPLKDIASLVTTHLPTGTCTSVRQNVPVTRTPADDFVSIAVKNFVGSSVRQNISLLH